jgi:hypothetical protein
MQLTMGKAGLGASWQDDFEETVVCEYCGGIARIAFVAHEGLGEGDFHNFLCDMCPEDGGLWVHDCCAVAVYFCAGCLEPTAVMNQG